MKNIIGILLIIIGGLSTPISIGFCLFEWSVNDLQFQHAAWGAFKLWILMLLCLPVGIYLGYEQT